MQIDTVSNVFEIRGKIMHYAWGKLGSESKVAQLAKRNLNSSDGDFETRPCAELWMGTHPNAPSELLHAPYTLHQVVTSNPTRFLGPNLSDLPFLFKVLSVQKALSIQAHPNRSLAQILHASQPEHYKDDNHKPEMAIALTKFETLFGFRPVAEIVENLQTYPEFQGVVGRDNMKAFLDHPSSIGIQSLLNALLTCPSHEVEHRLKTLIERLNSSTKPLDQLIQRVYHQYPNDVGVFCILLMNYVVLNPGEALFMGANKLHAYLSGDCVEVMATSDNVVRAGLTPKFKDVKTLIQMLEYTSDTPLDSILKPASHKSCPFTTVYDPPIEEFTVYCTEVPLQRSVLLPTVAGPRLLLVIAGEGKLEAGTVQSTIGPGSIWFASPNETISIVSHSYPIKVYSAFFV